MHNKRGLSAIVATVLIILLVIAGVTLVWTPVRKLITEQSEGLEASCLLANPQVTKACMSGPSAVQLTISNGAEGRIDGFQFIYGTTGALTQTDTSQQANPIEINQVKTMGFTNSTVATVVKIAPIVNGEACAAGSEITIAAAC
jgi:hypothetical protein